MRSPAATPCSTPPASSPRRRGRLLRSSGLATARLADACAALPASPRFIHVSSLGRRVFVWPRWRWVGRTVGGACETAARLTGHTSLLSLDKVREATVSSWACSAVKARRHSSGHDIVDLFRLLQLLSARQRLPVA